VPLTVVHSILAGERLNEDQWSIDGPSDCLMPAGKPGPFRTAVRSSASVDRLTGASERHSAACIEFRAGCGLWTVVSFQDAGAGERWLARVKAAFRLLADSGFGGERSRGWGRSDAPEFTEGALPDLILPIVEPTAAAVERASARSEELATAEAAVVAAPEVALEQASPRSEEPEPAATEAAAVAAPEISVERASARSEYPEPAATEAAAVAAPEISVERASARSEDPEPAAAEAAVVAAPDIAPLVADKPLSAETEAASGSEAPAEDAQPLGESEASTVQPEATVVEMQFGQAEISAPAEPSPAAEPEPERAEAHSTVEPEPERAEAHSTVEPEPERAGAHSTVEPEPERAEAHSTVEAETEAAAPAPAREPAAPIVEATPPAEPEPAPEPPAVELPPVVATTPAHPHWLLSLFAPAAADTVDWRRGNYTVLPRGGRVDSPAGSGELKKQIQMVAEGSVLYAENAPLGSAADVAPDGFAHPVFRAGFAVAIPLPEVR
jgi:hypothetical protein